VSDWKLATSKCNYMSAKLQRTFCLCSTMQQHLLALSVIITTLVLFVSYMLYVTVDIEMAIRRLSVHYLSVQVIFLVFHMLLNHIHRYSHCIYVFGVQLKTVLFRLSYPVD